MPTLPEPVEGLPAALRRRRGALQRGAAFVALGVLAFLLGAVGAWVSGRSARLGEAPLLRGLLDPATVAEAIEGVRGEPAADQR